MLARINFDIDQPTCFLLLLDPEIMSEERRPRKKVKFMCSFGGKILPRASDGVLKYVGGETRVVGVSADISFSELAKKLKAITEKDIVLKYQIVPEDLDALVSVKSDEDLKHMMEEYKRHETPKLRTFLFPANPENQLQPQTLEQRYIEAINGTSRLYPLHKVHSSPNILQQLHPPPNYFTCRLRPPASSWDPRFWGRATSVPQSPKNHALHL